MRRRTKRAATKIGLPPGAAVYVGEPRDDGVVLTAFVYDAQGMVEHQNPAPEVVQKLVAPGRVVWLDCDGVHDVALVSEICERFSVHPLAVEDVLNTSSRPKLDQYDDGKIVVSLHMVAMEGDEIVTEHVTLVVGVGVVLSFQEGRAGDLFDPVRHRIRSGSGRIRTLGVDYLTHALVDAIVDGYFAVLERVEDRIEAVEGAALEEQAPALLHRIYELKGDLATVRRSVLPLREVVSRLLSGEARLLSRAVEPYFRDLYDHVMTVIDMADAGRERLTSALEVHLAVASHRMNDVMKVLTVVATVFIPLSWVAGVYGMNFDNMPELHFAMGYPVAMGLMLAIGAGMLVFFRIKRWL